MRDDIKDRRTEQGRLKRLEILNFLVDYKAEYGYYPTREVLREGVGLSVGAITHHIYELYYQGYFTYERGSFARTLKMAPDKNRRYVR